MSAIFGVLPELGIVFSLNLIHLGELMGIYSVVSLQTNYCIKKNGHLWFRSFVVFDFAFVFFPLLGLVNFFRLDNSFRILG